MKKIHNFSQTFWKINKTKGQNKHQAHEKVSALNEVLLTFIIFKSRELICGFGTHTHMHILCILRHTLVLVYCVSKSYTNILTDTKKGWYTMKNIKFNNIHSKTISLKFYRT